MSEKLINKYLDEETKDFDKAFDSWFKKCNKMIEDHYEKHLKNSEPELLTFKKARKYIKVIQNGSAWAFVDKNTGDILKPATWSAPAKHARGNIFDKNNGMKFMGPYGPGYLR